MVDDSGALFIAVFEEPIAKSDLETIKQLFEVYQLNPQTVVLYAPDLMPATVPSNLFDFGSEKPGVVFKLNGSWAGHYYKDLWEWLKED